MDEYPFWQQVACSRFTAITLIWAAQFGIVFKRQMAEFKILSYVFLAIAIVFVCLLFSELMTDSVAVADTINMEEITRVKADHHLITSILIIFFALAIQFMVFPSYTELEKRSTERYTQVSFIYTTVVTT